MFAYVPQTRCPEHDNDESYLTLEEAIRPVPEGGYEEKILDLAIARDMTVCSTFLKKRETKR